jgi:hypothetical protein
MRGAVLLEVAEAHLGLPAQPRSLADIRRDALVDPAATPAD